MKCLAVFYSFIRETQWIRSLGHPVHYGMRGSMSQNVEIMFISVPLAFLAQGLLYTNILYIFEQINKLKETEHIQSWGWKGKNYSVS